MSVRMSLYTVPSRRCNSGIATVTTYTYVHMYDTRILEATIVSNVLWCHGSDMQFVCIHIGRLILIRCMYVYTWAYTMLRINMHVGQNPQKAHCSHVFTYTVLSHTCGSGTVTVTAYLHTYVHMTHRKVHYKVFNRARYPRIKTNTHFTLPVAGRELLENGLYVSIKSLYIPTYICVFR